MNNSDDTPLVNGVIVVDAVLVEYPLKYVDRSVAFFVVSMDDVDDGCGGGGGGGVSTTLVLAIRLNFLCRYLRSLELELEVLF